MRSDETGSRKPPFSTDQSIISMRSDETWNGKPQFGTPQEMLTRDEWILMQLNQYGAPNFHIMVSKKTL